MDFALSDEQRLGVHQAARDIDAGRDARERMQFAPHVPHTPKPIDATHFNP